MKTQRKRIPKSKPHDYFTLRGGIEVKLKNALTGEDIIHETGENVVLYLGRQMLMTRAFATATQTATIWPTVVIGSGSGATQASHTGAQAYFTFKAGTINQTSTGANTAQPMFNLVASWESTELNAAGFNSVREFLLLFNTTTGSGASGSPYLCRYLSNADINATTSNQLLVTYTVSF